jgi:LacI family transcriptional regulator
MLSPGLQFYENVFEIVFDVNTVGRQEKKLGLANGMTRPATLQDVAAMANVGISTVSKVLNGYSDIADDTRSRVLAAIKELQFVPNRTARAFRTGKTRTMSVFLPRIGDWFYDEIITSIDNTLADHDYDAALFPLLSQRRLLRYRSPDALPYHSDGVMLVSLNPEWLFPAARLPVDLPTVLVDAYHGDFDSITVDNRGAARAATSRLIERGGETYLLMIEKYEKATFSSGVFYERFAGFKEAFSERSVPYADDLVAFSSFSRAAARAATHRILDRASIPVNIVASCDLFAQGVMDEATARGLRIGTDVRVIGFDDQPWAESAGLTTVRQPIQEMGALAATFLFRRQNNSGAPAAHEELSTELVVRTSG